MINILIVEDNLGDQQKIREIIQSQLGHLTKMYPAHYRTLQHPADDLNNLHNLLSAILKREFEKVTAFYKQIDLFIIDVSLTDKSDRMGIEFLDHLRENYEQPFKAIVISNTNESKVYVDTAITPFISKMEHGISDDFPVFLVKTIKDIYQLHLETPYPDLSIWRKFKNYINRYGLKFALNAAWRFITGNIQRRIDKLALITFYLLMVITIVYGGYNIIKKITNSFFIKDGPDTIVLAVAESIFLYLLPVFIVFGFYNYYKTNTRISFLEGNISSVDHEASTKAMNLTKILFVSSVISYIIIKIVEEIFINKTHETTKLISYGVLLIILMVYLVFLDRRKH